MKCDFCEKKCNNKHCSYTYDIIEASKSGHKFKAINENLILECIDDGYFRYLINSENKEVYNPSREDFFKEYILI